MTCSASRWVRALGHLVRTAAAARHSGSLGWGAALVLVAASCLDALYEEGAPLTSGWVVCCPRGDLDSCPCIEESSCKPSVFACAAGRCSATPTCPAEAMDAGLPPLGDGGSVDGGLSDAGLPSTWELCCVAGRLSSCACLEGLCGAPAFTACAGGRCVESGDCPRG